MFLFDILVDFVKLRLEDYTESCGSSHVRGVKLEEDAYLNDLTINSLFYNINTTSVEDFTGKGMRDLKSGKIRTHLDPKETFLDDAVRVLRAIQFATSLGFELDEELRAALMDSEAKAAIKLRRLRRKRYFEGKCVGDEVVFKGKRIRDEVDLLFWDVFRVRPLCYGGTVVPLIDDGCDRLCAAYMDDAWYLFRWSLGLNYGDGEMVLSLDYYAAERFVGLIPWFLVIDDTKPARLDCHRGVDDDDDDEVPISLRVIAGMIQYAMEDLWRVTLLLSTLLYVPTTSDAAADYCLEKLWVWRIFGK
ncbi:hypothetical protein RHSIM_RhsimUnG0109800 [Rhododendron simsii]|uniref:Poly A polymerase head domain-containing protein n=1 Tax=Rhododendron simsii TaxID=118357 RepID=A0A834FWD3_RHOSS|nr:hypothetical protein RHSIM_RhsimUnG0109800 [Rhododendron simsii]